MKRWTHVVLSEAALGALLFIGEFGNTLSVGQQLGPQALPRAALRRRRSRPAGLEWW